MVSIIIPVYNSAQYLDRCIASAVGQTYEDLEIILINDGSLDNSLQICRKWSLIDKRISVIDKSNGGVSSARNAGLSASCGDYLVFLDSDDYLEPEMVEKMLGTLGLTGADIAFCGFTIFSDNGSRISCSAYTSDIISPQKAILQCFQKKNTWFYAGWAKMYLRKSVIDEKNKRFFYFDEDLLVGEDYKWLMTILTQSSLSCVACLDKCLYNYRRFSANPSLSNFRSERYLLHKESLLEADQYVASLFKRHNMREAYICSVQKLASEYTNGEVIVGSCYGYKKLRDYVNRHKGIRLAIFSLDNGIGPRVRVKSFLIHCFMLLPWPMAVLSKIVAVAEKERSSSLVL